MFNARFQARSIVSPPAPRVKLPTPNSYFFWSEFDAKDGQTSTSFVCGRQPHSCAWRPHTKLTISFSGQHQNTCTMKQKIALCFRPSLSQTMANPKVPPSAPSSSHTCPLIRRAFRLMQRYVLQNRTPISRQQKKSSVSILLHHPLSYEANRLPPRPIHAERRRGIITDAARTANLPSSPKIHPPLARLQRKLEIIVCK